MTWIKPDAVGVRRVVSVLASPGSAQESLERILPLADEVVCLWAPEDFYAVGRFYEVFDQVEDEEVRLLGENRT